MSAHYDSIILGAGPTGEVCAGELADAGRPVAVVERVEPRDRRHDRVRPRRHDDVVGAQLDARDVDAAGTGERRAAAVQVDALVLQPARGARVGVVGDHEVAPGQRGGDVDGPAVEGLPRARGVPCGGDRLARAQQGLGGDAGPVGALAAHQLAFDDGDPLAGVGELARADLAGRAGAEDDGVVVRAHVALGHPRTAGVTGPA